MTRRLSFGLSLLTFSLLGCGAAHADRVALQQETAPRAVLPESPYEVELVSENGATLPTYNKGGRYYVLGRVGERYTIRVNNPTPRRVEAVISVDGLDVIDGKSADFRTKRGYVVPARGQLEVPGWRVSTQQVAAFRFSSVSNSYAGRKGKARNVGVIGVAIFEEKSSGQVIVRERHRRRDHRRRRRLPPSPGPEASAEDEAPAADSALGGSGSAGAPSRRHTRRSRPNTDACCQKTERRPGLGTEFGERRSSAVSFTRFVRKNKNKPDAMAVLRYNDAAGLQALGIPLHGARPDQGEVVKRETANPFPGAFAQPPR